MQPPSKCSPLAAGTERLNRTHSERLSDDFLPALMDKLNEMPLVQSHPLKRLLLTKELKAEWAISHEIDQVLNRVLKLYSENRRATFNVTT